MIFSLYESLKPHCKYLLYPEYDCTLLGLNKCEEDECPLMQKISDVIDEFTDISEGEES